MVGYTEVLTDPSYHEQILTQRYHLIASQSSVIKKGFIFFGCSLCFIHVVTLCLFLSLL